MPLVRYGVLLLCLLSAACSDDDGGETTTANGAGGNGAAGNGSSGGGAGGGGDTGDRCHRGCMATLEAACDNGPGTLAECESDCNSLAAGPCAAEYDVLQDCADGEAVTCNAEGIPVIEVCADEQGVFIACLNQG